MANAKKTEGKTSNMKSKATEAYKAVNDGFGDPIGTIFQTAGRRWETEDKFRKDVTTSLTVLAITECLDVTDWI
tara:strand:+ start:1152 stop:1373 length:222 start_codon:yes stop_codon:yes gene_type:complete